MAINIECDECGRTYRIKDELAGKRIHCKECSAVIQVPLSDSDDDWEVDEAEDDGDVDHPPQRNSRRASGKPRSNAKPVTIIVALICLGLMIGISLLNILGGFIIDPALIPGAPPGGANPNAVKAGFIFGVCIKLLIQIIIFLGIMKRRRDSRIGGAILGAINLLLMAGRIAFSAVQFGEMVELVIGIVLRLIFIGCLMAPASGDYCRK